MNADQLFWPQEDREVLQNRFIILCKCYTGHLCSVESLIAVPSEFSFCFGNILNNGSLLEDIKYKVPSREHFSGVLRKTEQCRYDLEGVELNNCTGHDFADTYLPPYMKEQRKEEHSEGEKE